MDMGWVITLSSPSNPTAQISQVKGDGRAISIEAETA